MKIFLSYHKNTPVYKSDIFEPILVGAHYNKVDEIELRDDSGDNISELNPYYCELTGYYWVLKNYIDNSNEDYIGFAHYRRLPDIKNISDSDTPSIYGLNYSESLKLFESLIYKNLKNDYKKFEVILPCTCYMYKTTVNPLLRDNEKNYNLYNHFKEEHKNDLLDVLSDVIKSNYPEYMDSLLECFKLEKSHFFNIYIMKREILKKFLIWKFDILNKIGEAINGWNQSQYLRMAGFVGEVLINIWLKKHNNLKIGYVPIYMIDFESEYITKANQYHAEGKYIEEISELKKLYKISSDKFSIKFAIAQLYAQLNDIECSKLNLKLAEKYAKTEDEIFQLASFSAQNNIFEPKKQAELFVKAIEKSKDNKFYAQEFLFYAERIKDLSITKQAWDFMKKYPLTKKEEDRYKSFMEIYSLVHD